MKFCSKCGQQLADNVRFCTRCGAPDTELPQQPAQSRAVPWQPVYQQQVQYRQPAPKPGKKWALPVALCGSAVLVLMLAVGILALAGAISREPGYTPVYRGEPETSRSGDALPGEILSRDSVGYTVKRQDASLRSGDGEIIVRVEYSRVLVEEAWPELADINAYIEQDFQSFASVIRNGYEDGELEEYIKENGIGYDELFWLAGVEVMTNGGGILSLQYTTEWFMGGVYNIDRYGMTFDLNTGTPLTLTELTGLPEQELLAQLQENVCRALEPSREYLLSDPAEVLRDYGTEDYRFFVEDGKLVLVFPTYTFGPGTMGATTVYTDICVNENP